jgi:clan AA aspartic protease
MWEVQEMDGRIDASGRSLVAIQIGAMTAETDDVEVEAWIDTGFTGALVLPDSLIQQLGLERSGILRAELGDGSTTLLETFACRVEWFGLERSVQAAGNLGRFPLLGVELLDGHRFTADYSAGTVEIV